jgi:hypothetical protein
VSTSGTPSREHDILQLAPGSQSYVQIQWEANLFAARQISISGIAPEKLLGRRY